MRFLKLIALTLHGLGFSSDGKQLFITAHDGLVVYTAGKWDTIEGKKHDFMGFNLVDNGFYSSGHPAADSGLKNPLGIVKSTDNGKTLQQLDLYGIEDFHNMAVGFKSHTIYVFNLKPNAKMDTSGLYYSTDDAKSWHKSAMRGITSEPFSIAAHSNESGIVALGTKEGLFISNDYGNQFELLPIKSPSTALAFGKQGELFIGGPDSIIKKESSHYITYKIPALDKDDTVQFITQNPNNVNELVFTTFKKSIYITSDEGLSWKEIVHFGDVIS